MVGAVALEARVGRGLLVEEPCLFLLQSALTILELLAAEVAEVAEVAILVASIQNMALTPLVVVAAGVDVLLTRPILPGERLEGRGDQRAIPVLPVQYRRQAREVHRRMVLVLAVVVVAGVLQALLVSP